MLTKMKESKMFWVVASILMGFLQAWDSGAFEAGAFAQGLIVAGTLLPAIAIAAPVGQGIRIAALVAAALILVWARMIVPHSLNALHLGLFVPAVYILFVCGLQDAVSRRTTT